MQFSLAAIRKYFINRPNEIYENENILFFISIRQLLSYVILHTMYVYIYLYNYNQHSLLFIHKVEIREIRWYTSKRKIFRKLRRKRETISLPLKTGYRALLNLSCKHFQSSIPLCRNKSTWFGFSHWRDSSLYLWVRWFHAYPGERSRNSIWCFCRCFHTNDICYQKRIYKKALRAIHLSLREFFWR